MMIFETIALRFSYLKILVFFSNFLIPQSLHFIVSVEPPGPKL